jgi:hypothetical protein
MPTTRQQQADEHKDQGRHNEKIYRWLVENLIPADPSGVGWVFVVMQYAAYHYTTAKLIEEGARLTRYHHDRRNDDGTVFRGHISVVGQYLGSDIETAYDMLHSLGQQARYQTAYRRFNRADDALLEIRLQDIHLQAVKTACGVA